MSEKIVQLNEDVIRCKLKELVHGSIKEILNELLEAEVKKLIQSARYECNEQRQGYCSGHYSRNLTTTSRDVTLKVPKLKGISFETVIIERYRRRESGVEKALIEMYLAGACVRRVEDITGALRDRKASLYHQWLNKKAYVHIGDWHNRLLQDGRYSYVYVNRIYLNHIWGGEFEAVHSRSRTGCVGRSGCRISHGAIAPSTLAVVKPMAYGVSVSFLYIVSSLQQPNNTTEKGK